MTVILVDLQEGRIGADMLHSSAERRYLGEKIHQVGDLVVAAAGYASELDKFLAWVRAGRKRAGAPKLSEGSFEAVICHASGLVEHLTSDLQPARIQPVNRWFALGSGAHAAMGAAMAGAPLERALEIACHVVPSCGAPFSVASFSNPHGGA
jgi:hypothetical protein